jgi:hypothetical protein
MEVGRKLSGNVWLSYNQNRVGRFKFYQFDEFLNNGIQFFPYATINELKRSWRITKKLLKTRSKPKARPGMLGSREGIFIYRNARIVGEESLMRQLNATRFMSEKVMSL